MLHILADFREPSISRAAHEAAEKDIPIRIYHARPSDFANPLGAMLGNMKGEDSGLVAVLSVEEGEIKAVGKVLSKVPASVLERVTISTSRASEELINAFSVATPDPLGRPEGANPFEASREEEPKFLHNDQSTPIGLPVRRWIQHQLMLALIQGSSPEEIFKDLIDTLRGRTKKRDLAKEERIAERFFKAGEPDMAGGNYAAVRSDTPNLMDRLRDRIVQVGEAGLRTLLVGKTGAGKEAAAWYLHDFSPWREGPFLAVNCAFSSDELLESELFGHVKGAFSGADRNKPGLVETANQGTLFLDELPEMSERLQAKVLRFLQDGSYIPVGDTKEKRAKVRVIAAAQPALIQKIRPDLLYRLAEVQIDLPELKDLAEDDIAHIAKNFADRQIWQKVMKNGRETEIRPDRIYEVKREIDKNKKVLKGYSWPGNMRELGAIIKRRVFLGDRIFEELAQKLAPLERGASSLEIDIKDKDLDSFLEPFGSLEELSERFAGKKEKENNPDGTKGKIVLDDMSGAYIRHIWNSCKARNIPLNKQELARTLKCSTGTVLKYIKAG